MPMQVEDEEQQKLSGKPAPLHFCEDSEQVSARLWCRFGPWFADVFVVMIARSIRMERLTET